MRLRVAGIIFVLACLSVAVPTVGRAQGGTTSAQAQANAREAFRRGEAAYSAGNYDAAVREWNNAYSSDPRPRIQFNLSQAYERMGRLEDAIGALKRFLESGDPEDPTYSDANARLVALQQRLASTGVMLQGGADGGSILVDDQDWGRTPRPDKITVAPGNHVLVVRWPSGREFRTNVFVPAGQVVEILVPNEDGSAAPPAAGAPVAQPTPAPAPGVLTQGPAEEPRNKKKILLYGLGAGTAALGTGLLVYGIVRGTADGDCGSTTSEGRIYCNPDSVDSARRQSIAGYVSGGLLLAGGAALLVVGALSGRDDRRASACGLGPTGGSCRFTF